MAKKPAGVRRKLVEFDAQTWQALDLLARDSMKTFHCLLYTSPSPRDS